MVTGHQSRDILQSKISMAVPAGFVLTPQEPTERMYDLARAFTPGALSFFRQQYLAAVEAAKEVQHQDTRPDEVPDRAPPADSNPPPAWPDSGRYLSPEAL
jgi:hypothetical protein